MLKLWMALTLALACGGAQTPDAGLQWACEFPRCCANNAHGCIDYGCCENDGWRVAP